ncbi:beta-ketoacyl-[acyl-carrier-protein] synthase family protein [Mucilaginibacter gossypii]|uniref:beta-ketoacyl-[acyl-carrier-protein] synthase family protein n=1 Tax=Mucilaginibacter gossypii TaxID=551996 RepID=UPI000DCBD1BB|nr:MULTISPECIES: beta-ketoacyl-[acyl-carrier-protein] synthase family protein [Mucilaginibacter]QTE35756.1 beta-ketoacyl-[acyl-carrier-protein] synthase family protein [Mucilaginibacter gossypii]RAV56885.1 beta-ketoacyl-[acyl-carrier-protein] synthase family protein [Mucilaginibacter rubeus]
MEQPVFIAGAGVISAIGNTVAQNLLSLEQEKTGIAPIQYLDTEHRDEFPVGEIKLSNQELAELSGFKPGISRTAMLSSIAAKEALADTELANLAGLRTGFISANTVGGMDKTEDFFRDFLANNTKGRLRNVVNNECDAVTNLVADQLGIRHYVSTISTACSSSANAIMYGARLIKNNILDVVIAGGADAFTRFTLNGFNTLMILDKQPCQPFDANRRGLNLGEGAGYVVLVSARIASSLKKEMYCTLSGYHNANDAYHQTASSPEGTGSLLAMEGALKKSGLKPADIGYINLHGTGTQNNDSSEGAAISKLFAGYTPQISSTKAFTGHTLGASGGIEAVFSALAVQRGLVYPNLRFETSMEGLPFTPETRFSKQPEIKHVLSNSFGFGGNCSSLIFSKL